MRIFSKKTFGTLFLSVLLFSGLLLSLQACGTELTAPVTVASPTANPSPTLTTVTSPVPPTINQSSTPNTQITTINPTPLTPTLPADMGPFTPPPTFPPKTANKNSWQYNWLNKIPCAAPCWEGITPGVTTFAEAKEILKKKPYVNLTDSDPTDSIWWSWVNGKKRPTGLAACDPCLVSPPILNYIGMSFEVSFRLEDIIKVYGEPTHVETILYPIDGKWNYLTYFLFLNHGFKIGFQTYTYTKPIISPDLTEEFGVGFFPITDEKGYNEKAIRVGQEPRTSVWEGYKSYDFYCRDLKGQDYCKQVKNL